MAAATFLALAVRAMALSDPTLPDAPVAQMSTAQTAATPSAATPGATSPGLTGPGRDNTFLGLHVGPAYPLEAGKYDALINPGEHAQPLTAGEKVLFGLHEQIQPVVLIPALFSAGYGQIADANPHYGVDAGGFGERYGAALLRQATDRITGDGLLAAAFRQDPRYYRSDGPVLHRGLLAVRQTFLRRTDHGDEQINFSGIGGHAIGNFLAMTYYPHVSATASVAAQGFGTSLAADMGSKLIVEFGPDVLRLVFRRNP